MSARPDPATLRAWGRRWRAAKLAAYRQTRDQIRDRMIARFGPPTEPQD